MRAIRAAIGVTAIFVLGSPTVLSAQETGWQTRGMFGDRTLGRALSPSPAQRLPGVQTGPSGNFLGVGRADGTRMFPTPWRQIEPAPVVVPATMSGAYSRAIAPAAAEAVGPQATPPVQLLPSAEAGQQELYPETSPGAEGVLGESAGEAGTGGEPAAVGGGAALPAVKWTLAGSASVAAARAASYRVSPELSARMTRIARTKGVGTRAGITVALGNGTAVLRGEVTSSHAREMLGNVARLEPGVWQVDNRLSVQP